MTQRIFAIDRWTEVTDKTQVDFYSSKGMSRKVVLQVNAPQRTNLILVTPEGEPHFLARVEGRDEIEFTHAGDFSLTVEEGTVYVASADGQKVHIAETGAATFTKIAERRRYSPEVMMMQAAMRENQRRLEAMMAGEIERRVQAHVNRQATNRPAPSENGAGPEPKPEPKPEAGVPVEPNGGGANVEPKAE